MLWQTLRNPNTALAPSVSDEYMVVPILKDPRVIGYAVVKISDLTPEFKTLKEAQQWAESQAGSGGTSRRSTNPPREGNAK
jgi:hypothetical protein